MKKWLVAIVLLVSIVGVACAEITKIEEYNDGEAGLYFSTQLWSLATVFDPKSECLSSFMSMMSNTDCEDYKKHYKGLPNAKEIKMLKAEELKDDVLKLLDIKGGFHVEDSYWAGKEGGGKTSWLVWKEEGRIYCYEVVYNRTRGIGLYK